MHKHKLTKITFHFLFAESQIGNGETKFQSKKESCFPFLIFRTSEIGIRNREQDLQFYLKQKFQFSILRKRQNRYKIYRNYDIQ